MKFNFSDMLKAPLPSQMDSEPITESNDDASAVSKPDADHIGTIGGPGAGDIRKKAVAASGNKTLEDGDEGDVTAEAETSETAPELQPIAGEIDPEDPTDAVISDDLSEDDDTVTQRIDDTIQRAATPILLGGELSGDEADGFIESVDCDAAISDGLMTERTIVKFDKKARFAQLHKVAVLAIAKEKKDALYKKLVTAWRIEKTIETRLVEKYGTQANARVRAYIQNAKKSRSNPIRKAAEKLSK